MSAMRSPACLGLKTHFFAKASSIEGGAVVDRKARRERQVVKHRRGCACGATHERLQSMNQSQGSSRRPLDVPNAVAGLFAVQIEFGP